MEDERLPKLHNMSVWLGINPSHLTLAPVLNLDANPVAVWEERWCKIIAVLFPSATYAPAFMTLKPGRFRTSHCSPQ